MHTIDEWKGCYPSSWKGVIVPEAMAHPAKYSSKLIRKIYEHMITEGWLKAGDRVIDPFGGVALGALDAMRLGLHWTGIELEKKFQELGGAEYLCCGITPDFWKQFYHRPKMLKFFRDHRLMCPTCEASWNDIADRKIPQREPHTFRGNIPLWANKFRAMPKFGTARLLNGDSRNLVELIGASVEAAVSSPPYSEARIGQESGQESCGRGDQYGETPGQLGAMKGDGFQVALSSPPYADSVSNPQKGGIDWEKAGRPDRLTTKSVGIQSANGQVMDYGSTPGQLGSMKGDGFDVAISSPPYSETLSNSSNETEFTGNGGAIHPRNYGFTEGQLGSMKGDGFDAAISSPPYAETDLSYKKNGLKVEGKDKYERPYMVGQDDHYGATGGQLGAMKGGGFDAAISSPPFLQSEGGVHNSIGDAALMARHAAGNKSAHAYGESDGQLSSMKDGGFQGAISSPPYSAMQVEKNAKSIDRTKQYEVYKKSGGGQTFEQFCHTQDIHSQGYGNSDGQLSAMPARDFDAAISSPPFQGTVLHDGGKAEYIEHKNLHSDYGDSDGQLSAMPAGDFDAAVSSPPFEKGSEGVMRADKFKDPEAFARVQMNKGHGSSFEAKLRAMQKDNERFEYGQTAGNIGNDSGDDFWLAARQIVEQVYLSLAPGGHAAWVVKNYVKNKQIVPFCDQWRQLCEAVGFVTLHEHHASLIRNQRTQHTLDGGTVNLQAESKSFFRRLAEKNGSPRIDYETVLCMEKPNA